MSLRSMSASGHRVNVVADAPEHILDDCQATESDTLQIHQQSILERWSFVPRRDDAGQDQWVVHRPKFVLVADEGAISTLPQRGHSTIARVNQLIIVRLDGC